jgi:hypothetical protein
MKKFFIAFLILAVTAANVFAQVTFSGQLHGRWDVIAGKSGKDGSPAEEIYAPGEFTTKLGDAAGGLIRSRFHITAVNEDKTWGGWMRVQTSDPAGATGQARVWWQPISQVKVVLGQHGFRPFGTFGGLDVHDYLNSEKYAVGDVFPEYNATQGFALELTPIANLKIGLITPIVSGEPAEVSYRRFSGWAGYTLEGIGTIGLGFKGSANNYSAVKASYKDYGLADAQSQINVGFDLTAIENLKAQIGVWYPIAQKALLAVPSSSPTTYLPTKLRQEPITVALAADYTVPDTFGVRFLFSTKFLGKTEQENEIDNTEDGLIIAFTLDPWVNIGVGNVGLGFGLKSTGASKADDGEGQKDDKLELTATPYFSKSYGGGTFYAGVRIGISNYTNDEQYKDDYGVLSWAIPVGFQYSF